MSMRKFAGWRTAEEFAAWEEQNFQCDAEAVKRAYRMQAARRAPTVPLWLVLIVGSFAGVGLVWLICLLVAGIGEWLQSLF